MRARPTTPTKSKAFVVPVALGGSGAGFSMYEALLECPRRVWLDRQLRACGMPVSSDNHDTMTGTCVHGLLARYYKKGMRFDSENVVYQDVSGSEWSPPLASLRRAARLFRHYATKFSPDEWTVLGVEKHYKVGPSASWKPAGLELTAQLDLEVKISPAQARKLLVTRRVVLRPGYYIVDHKSHKSDWAGMHDKHVLSVQQEGYGLVWKDAHPRRQLQGRLINLLIEGGMPKFRTLVLPPPDDESEKRIRAFLLSAQKRLQEPEPYEAAQGACLTRYGSVCPHFAAGRCLRY